MNKNLRVGICPHTKKEVVQVRDHDEESGWLCCHNEDDEDDKKDVLELEADPSGNTCIWANPLLQRLQKDYPEYDQYI